MAIVFARTHGVGHYDAVEFVVARTHGASISHQLELQLYF